jgi:phage tail sheath protein FI
MPITPTYPGVYVEEIPSGVRTIVGVATSITAFIGRALRGPVDDPVVINNFGDFEREFGGLWLNNSLGYAVSAFFRNGGSQAIVVRLYREANDAGGNPLPSKAKLEVGGMKLVAASEGAWGTKLRATVDQDVSQEAADALGVAKSDLFNLTVTDQGTQVTETYRNVTVAASVRRVDQILKRESSLVRWDGDFPAQAPAVKAEDDPVSKAEKDYAPAKKAHDDAVAAKQKADDAKAKADKELADAQAETPPDPTKVQAAQQKAQQASTDATNANTAATSAKNTADTAKTKLDDALKKASESASNGDRLTSADFKPQNAEKDKKGLFALEDADLFNLLCIPPYRADGEVDPAVVTDAAVYCEKRRAMLLVDPPVAWRTPQNAIDGKPSIGTTSKNAALFFPRVFEPDPLKENREEEFAPSGTVAGVMARTDATRGVWKAPAGLEATLTGVRRPSVPLTDAENGQLNPVAINCLRVRPAVGPVVWGARTLQGDDRLASEWKYIPVRRLALYIEESLFRGTQWVVFEPNDEPLWSQIRLNVTVFMHDLFRQGAFQGLNANDAYLVKVDKETTTQSDINRGVVNIVVGFAPLKPAEFVFLKIKQLAGQLEV